MTWLLPWALGAAVAAAIGVTLLHLLARDRPPRWLLPTARFVAPGTARATRRARTPRDLPLLLVRALALLLAGAAFAAPVRQPEGGNVAQVIVLDVGDARRARPAIDSARARHRDGDRLVVIDSAVRLVAPGAERALLDSLAAARAADEASRGASRRHGGDQPTLTGALIAAARAAVQLPPQADSASLVLVAPGGAHDAALARARGVWPGRATVVDVVAAVGNGASATTPDDVMQRPAVRGPSGDPVVAAARVAGATLTRPGALPAEGSLLVVRDTVTAADSAWAARGGTLVAWLPPPGGPPATGTPDTVGGIVVDGRVALFQAVRRGPPPDGRVVGRWIDGEAAVTETLRGEGCIRVAAVAVPTVGDVALRPAFQAALRSLMAPCAEVSVAPLVDSTRTLLVGEGPLAVAGALRAGAARSSATPWLLGAALLLLAVAEPMLRRRSNAQGGATP